MDEDSLAIVPLESIAPSGDEASAAPALRPAEQLAASVARVMDLIAKRLELETPQPSTARRVRGARTVPREFVVSMIAVAERHPDFPFIGKFDSAEARSVLESSDANRVLAERTAMLLASLNYTIEARWAKVVADAMYAFSQASIVAEMQGNAEVAAEIENLRRLLGRKGQRKKKAAKKSEPAE